MVRTQSLDFLVYQQSVLNSEDVIPMELLRVTEYMNMLVIFNSITSFDLFPFSV